MRYKQLAIFIFLTASMLSHAAQENQEINPERNTQLFCHDQRRLKVNDPIATPSMIVLNYSLQPTAQKSHHSFRNQNLSVHYIIDKDGKIYKGIGENLEEIFPIEGTPVIDQEYLKQRAWHTGVGYWNGEKEEINNINTHAIGILFVNEGSDNNKLPDVIIGNPDNTTHWFEFTPEQELTFIKLAVQLKTIYNIADKDIVGFGEVRTDKNNALSIGVGIGPKFPWQSAAQQGVGLYHTLTEEQLAASCESFELENLQKSLHAWGYSVTISGQEDKQTLQAIKQLQIHHDSRYYNSDDQYNTCRAYHIIHNLLAQHLAKKENGSQ